MTIGTAIKIERIRVGLTQEQCAERAGFDQTKMSRLEKGLQDAKYAELVKLSLVFGRPLNAWLPEAAEPEPAQP